MKKQADYTRWIPSILWMGFIFFLSHQQGGSSSELSSGITETLYSIIHAFLPRLNLEADFFHFLVRKGAHFTAYLILALFVAHAMKQKDRTSFFRVFFFCMLYANSDEFHQTFVPGRSGELRDVLIDSSGAVTGILLYLNINFRKTKIVFQEAMRKSS
ncbi:VanZ family protein [Proteiniclasticum sp. C24MP]|uniref:VanZ family protein n=1 Tax=Proteiniclasticum sp. C24MP TaxID=3374101 RepID=UPI003754E57F